MGSARLPAGLRHGPACRYIHRGLEISASEAERMRRGTAGRVVAGRKLLLMLDLDHTLLNSSRFGEVDEQGGELVAQWDGRSMAVLPERLFHSRLADCDMPA